MVNWLESDDSTVHQLKPYANSRSRFVHLQSSS